MMMCFFTPAMKRSLGRGTFLMLGNCHQASTCGHGATLCAGRLSCSTHWARNQLQFTCTVSVIAYRSISIFVSIYMYLPVCLSICSLSFLVLTNRRRMLYDHKYDHAVTNFNVVPILSWGSIGLDWEWRDLGTQAEEDVQTRNSIGCDDLGLHCNDTAFILAQSTGLQAGIVSVAISSGLRGPKCTSRPDLNKSMCQQWLLKTHYATTIPHEMRPEGHFWIEGTVIPASPSGIFAETPNVNRVPALLDAAGYANPDCDVFRFWEPGFPIDTTGAVVLPLVIRCIHQVLVFFGSFGPRGTVNFHLDRAALGLSANAQATDAENGAAIAKAGQNFTFGIDKHSFRIVVIA